MLGNGQDPENQPPPTLDCSWIIKHHSNELIIPITLQEPSRFARVVQSIRNWRPGSTANGETSDKTTGTGTNAWKRDKDASFRISIAELHRIRMRKLQFKLASHAWYMKRNMTEPPGPWEADLQEYTKALQDYDYMIKCTSAQRDWFLISGERMVDAYVMYRVGVQPVEDKDEGEREHSVGQEKVKKKKKRGTIPVLGPWEEENTPIGGTRNENVKKSWVLGFRQRVVMAALGGAFLIAPMWLMVLHNTLYTALVSTTVFVFVFGLMMSALLEKPMDVLSGTAAYAAVLVVFVGLGPSGGASS
ncbi:hypothetical protein QBC47DRAFT_307927 [Echria macrotheca]|uniref:DUF6594 domain-containing protein n=1 Tax=Echria macrotheca TaxID=438768 RepID=A0AAJ0B6X2_9PEZI|nr:hypothetical protein QBC47DRAFT_307927 [Echria macrotheca]